MSTSIPFHESGQQYNREGASEECLWNEHLTCRNPRCGCSCHKQLHRNIPDRGSNRPDSGNHTGPVQTGLDKYCPVCKVKANSDQNFCTADGAKLSSLRCPECGTPGEQSHQYCGYCGCSMKAEDRLMEAAATGSAGNRLPVDSTEISTGDINAEASMRVAMGERVVKTVPAPTRPKISMGMFK